MTSKPIRFAAFLLLFACPSAFSGVWTRTGPESVSFEGEIELGEYDRFALVFGPTIRELAVNSRGGVTEEGIRIGHAVAAQSVKVVVIGYHGNVQACFTGARRDEMVAEWRRRYNMSDEDVRRNLAEQDRRIAEEARLLRVMGVSQELFDRTCTADKGMGDGKGYAFLLPKRATFERYGLWGIVGAQDPAVMAALPYPYAHD